MGFSPLARTAISRRAIALKTRGSPFWMAASRACICVRDSFLASINQRRRTYVSNNRRGSSDNSYFDLTASHRSEVPVFTMSPMIRAFRAQLLRGDFGVARFAEPRTATGRPRGVIVIGPPDCSIS